MKDFLGTGLGQSSSRHLVQSLSVVVLERGPLCSGADPMADPCCDIDFRTHCSAYNGFPVDLMCLSFLLHDDNMTLQ